MCEAEDIIYEEKDIPSFACAIAITGMNVAVVFVDDGDTGSRFQGSGPASLVSAATVQVNLVAVGPTPVLDTRLTAGADTGLAAVIDGGTRGGVASLALPYP